MPKFNVTHLTSAHSRYDTRIFIKMCSSLASVDYHVSLVVADGIGNEIRNGVHIIDVGKNEGGRLSRMIRTVNKVFIKAKELDSDIYHFHDPELIPIALKLKKLNKIVIFDSHEDIPKQILSKPYLNIFLRNIIGFCFSFYEKITTKKFDAVITATPFIRDKFLSINSHTININNFPIIDELHSVLDCNAKYNEVCYIGGISEIRGIREIVRSMEYVKEESRLQIGGEFNNPPLENELKDCPGWQFIDAHGYLDRKAVSLLLSRSVAGLVLFHPLPNHIDAQPNKMFEYMSAGIPVIASNFPLWRSIIEGNDCGLCVDPLDPHAIAEAIDFLINNSERAKQMGINGYGAVRDKYNWEVEELKLFELYTKLIEENL